jgi:hypothetical protein
MSAGTVLRSTDCAVGRPVWCQCEICCQWCAARPGGAGIFCISVDIRINNEADRTGYAGAVAGGEIVDTKYGVSVQKGTSAVPDDGRYHVVVDGNIVLSTRVKSAAIAERVEIIEQRREPSRLGQRRCRAHDQRDRARRHRIQSRADTAAIADRTRVAVPLLDDPIPAHPYQAHDRARRRVCISARG